MRFSKSILITAATALLPLVSQATPITPTTTISVGGYVFNDFSCQATKSGAAVGNCSTLGVAPLTQPLTGIQFITGQMVDGLLSVDDALVNYHVHSTNQISNIGLDFNGTFLGWAVASVTETVKNDQGLIVGFADVTCGKFAGCSQQDNIALRGSYDDLYVIKDIKVAAIAGYADISYVDQTFDATAPEPASFAMLGIGLLGAGLLRRRSKTAVKA